MNHWSLTVGVSMASKRAGRASSPVPPRDTSAARYTSSHPLSDTGHPTNTDDDDDYETIGTIRRPT